MLFKRLPFISVFVFYLSFPHLMLHAHPTDKSDNRSTGREYNYGHKNCASCHLNEGTGLIQNGQSFQETGSTSSYIPYQSSTVDAYIGQPNGISKLCLSCHDGTLARDNFRNQSYNSGILQGKQIMGSTLSDDHPVSFVYNGALANRDGQLADPFTTASGLGGTIYTDLLVEGRLECTSCHDIHSLSGEKKLLRIPNRGSALCLTCHLK